MRTRSSLTTNKECILCWRQTRLALGMNVFGTGDKRIYRWRLWCLALERKHLALETKAFSTGEKAFSAGDECIFFVFSASPGTSFWSNSSITSVTVTFWQLFDSMFIIIVQGKNNLQWIWPIKVMPHSSMCSHWSTWFFLRKMCKVLSFFSEMWNFVHTVGSSYPRSSKPQPSPLHTILMRCKMAAKSTAKVTSLFIKNNCNPWRLYTTDP